MEESIYGVHTRQANAFLNGPLPRSLNWSSWAFARGYSFPRIVAGLARGEAGKPRMSQRCEWPIGPCVVGCTAKHINGDAQHATEAA